MGAPATDSYMAEAGRGFKPAAIEERRADAHLAETVEGVAPLYRTDAGTHNAEK